MPSSIIFLDNSSCCINRVPLVVTSIRALGHKLLILVNHSSKFGFENKNQELLIQASGRIVKLVHSELSEETIPRIIEASREYGFGKLTLRVAMDPELQPRLQGSLDRQLAAKGGSHSGFVAKQPQDAMLLLCLQS